jgi:hypothetical protein
MRRMAAARRSLRLVVGEYSLRPGAFDHRATLADRRPERRTARKVLPAAPRGAPTHHALIRRATDRTAPTAVDRSEGSRRRTIAGLAGRTIRSGDKRRPRWHALGPTERNRKPVARRGRKATGLHNAGSRVAEAVEPH